MDSDNNILKAKFDYSRNIKKYFSTNFFYAKFERKVDSVDVSILQVPVISNVIMLAWTIGADVYIEEVDKTFFKSLEKTREIMEKWYPGLSFDTEINVKNIVSNDFSNENYGLLFTGGIDSTTSYIRHKDKKPKLILIGGLQPTLTQEKAWKSYKERMIEFSRIEGVDINFIETNSRDFLKENLITKNYGKYFVDSWWVFRHGMTTIGICAPLTKLENIGTLLVASTHTQEFEYPWGSHPLIDNNIAWNSLKVIHDGFEFSRQEKIRYFMKDFMGEYIKKYGNYPFLQICNHADLANGESSCGKCDKCLSAIVGLTLENIDPNKCGFNVDENTYNSIKNLLAKGEAPIRGLGSISVWRDIQNHIPEEVEHDLYGSKDFFKWFKNFDFSEYEKKIKDLRFKKGRSSLIDILKLKI